MPLNKVHAHVHLVCISSYCVTLGFGNCFLLTLIKGCVSILRCISIFSYSQVPNKRITTFIRDSIEYFMDNGFNLTFDSSVVRLHHHHLSLGLLEDSVIEL